MQEKFYQACYTRVGVNEGWKTLHYSTDIPQVLLAAYEKNEAGNEVKRGTPLDKNGNALWMLEVLCEKGFVGMSRTQYGLSDAFGRSNFFSHGYLFPDAYELLKNPNALLGISDENFKTKVEETESVPECLMRKEAYSIEKALDNCHMTKENYIIYIKCLYYALSTNTNNTIYVRTNGEDEIMRNLLYLAYMAVPYSLRIKITASSCTELDNTNRMLIFGENIPEYSRYVDPWTGENNILTPAIEKRWERNPFVTCFAENCEREEYNEKLFRDMEKWLVEMGDILLNGMDALRIAYMMSTEDIDNVQDDEIMGLIYDWLALPVASAESYDHQTAVLLSKMLKRKIRLGEEAEQMLTERVASSVSEKLKDTYLQYLAFVTAQLTEEEGYRYLNELGKENPVFVKLRAVLSEKEEGRKLLCGFYLHNIGSLTANPDCTYGDLIEAYYDCEDMEEIEPEAQTLLHKKNIEIARTEIRAGIDFETVKTSYKNTELDIRRSGKIAKELCEEYDCYIHNHFHTDDMDKYWDFYVKWEKALSSAEGMLEYIECMEAAEAGDYQRVKRYIESDISYEIDGRLVQLLYEYIISGHAAEKCMSFTFWSSLARWLDRPLVNILAENRVGILCDSKLLQRSLETDIDFWTSTERIERFYGECIDYADHTGDKMLAASCDVLKREIKQRRVEEKKRKKEQEKRARQAEGAALDETQPVKRKLFGWKK